MDDRQMYTDLGRFGAQLESVSKMIHEMREESKEEREEFKEKLAILNKLEAEFNKARPVLEDINKWKERTIGAVMFASAISAVVSTYLIDVINFIKFKWGS